MYRRCRPHQRIALLWWRRSLWLLRRPVILARLWVAILRRRYIPILRHASILLERTLLLVHPRLRLERRFHQAIRVPAWGSGIRIRLPERPEAILGWCRTPTRIYRSGPRRGHRMHQELLIQMSAGLRLPLLDRP